MSKPRVVINEEDKSVSVEYGIAEKQQVILKNIKLSKINSELQSGAKSILTNQEGKPINIVELENDLRKLITHFQNEGYYFASITNLNSNTLINYDKSFAFVDLNPEITLDKKVCFNEFVINGNVETNTAVIAREIDLVSGELITPVKIETIRQRLSGLNLFSSLRITPYMIYEAESNECPKTNLIVQVKEKDFGLVEIAPGFRTDLGAKLSTGIIYNNLNGMNRSASLRLQGNRRVNLDGFDSRRKEENKDLIEYSVKASFVEPYLFHDILKTQVEFELSSSFQRIRFTKFDADIFRLSPQFSKTFTKWLSTSVRYQFERIIQFDATELKDNDNFSIGGITPSLTFDFRDDIINPKKGAFFNLSSEWANSNFGSMKLDDLEVNFVKVISRNRFYYPIGNFVVALSIAGGYQKNFANKILMDSSGNPVLHTEGYDKGKPKTKGYIPSIKVFRLDGYDEIRGYDDGEINRLMDGTPVGEVIVQNEAYFTAIKFEPRYSLTDNLKLGVFFDAGRVFVSDFRPFKLRSSLGAGIKYVTPVGSLDFDYGVKLQRKTNTGGVRDSMGRFHLSIGFF
ncbi:MAG: BamA/TamA family outer membrane protein [Bacteriovoracaceae bacterium]|nr:BamA/TamA family outer membrane protein [Bacteriovoracaceae bacterium]